MLLIYYGLCCFIAPVILGSLIPKKPAIVIDLVDDESTEAIDLDEIGDVNVNGILVPKINGLDQGTKAPNYETIQQEGDYSDGSSEEESSLDTIQELKDMLAENLKMQNEKNKDLVGNGPDGGKPILDNSNYNSSNGTDENSEESVCDQRHELAEHLKEDEKIKDPAKNDLNEKSNSDDPKYNPSNGIDKEDSTGEYYSGSEEEESSFDALRDLKLLLAEGLKAEEEEKKKNLAKNNPDEKNGKK